MKQNAIVNMYYQIYKKKRTTQLHFQRKINSNYNCIVPRFLSYFAWMDQPSKTYKQLYIVFERL